MNTNASPRCVAKIAALLTFSTAAMIAGCSTDSETAATASSAARTSSSVVNTGPPPADPSSTTPEAHSQPRGLMAVTSGKSNGFTSTITIGFVDPASGNYSRFKTFTVGTDWSKLGAYDVGFSPDLSKYAITRPIDGVKHAGWMDDQGNFTDVNAAEVRDPFGGYQNNLAVGFDGFGNFYYEKFAEKGGSGLYKVPPGSEDAGTLVVELGSYPTTNPPWNPHLLGDGSMDIRNQNVCLGLDFYSWLTPSVWVTTEGSHLYVIPTPTEEDLTGCGNGPKQPLLPETNDASAEYPMASPDGKSIAFLHDGSDLYVVDADGATLPRKLPPIQGAEVRQLEFVRWI
ncbi:hypothetical protein ACFYSW_29120 [Rhodococcus aetherivorans]|uniref:hypothetical protein n=1 Tax=Rhodococcus aetherivorans TaxID=191292 RepID=UPI0036774A01